MISALIVSFILCFVLTWLVIPRVIAFAYQKNLFDVPNDRKIHSENVPRLGGVAFLPVGFFAFLIIASFSFFICPDIWESFISHAFQLLYWMCALIILFIFGINDDLHGLRYRTKFLAQILSGIILCFSGIWINNFHGLLGLYEIPPLFGYFITIFVVVFIDNAFNFIDGIDGLAAGLSIISFLYSGVLLYSAGQFLYTLLCCVLIGILIPFIYYNIFGKPKKHRKIFMGDTGTLMIGFVMAVTAIIIVRITGDIKGKPNPMILAFAPLIIPCFDVIRVVLHRVRKNKSPFKADQNHIHHKLLDLGYSQHKVLIILIISSIVCTVINVLLSIVMDVNVIILIDLILWTVINIYLTKKINKIKISYNEN